CGPRSGGRSCYADDLAERIGEEAELHTWSISCRLDNPAPVCHRGLKRRGDIGYADKEGDEWVSPLHRTDSTGDGALDARLDIGVAGKAPLWVLPAEQLGIKTPRCVWVARADLEMYDGTVHRSSLGRWVLASTLTKPRVPISRCGKKFRGLVRAGIFLRLLGPAGQLDRGLGAEGDHSGEGKDPVLARLRRGRLLLGPGGEN